MADGSRLITRFLINIMYQSNQDNTVNLSKVNRPRLALTLGDPAGIGSEVILKALADSAIGQNCDVTVVGSKDLLNLLHSAFHKP